MTYTTLITTDQLASHLDDPHWAIVDCRFSLDRPDRGSNDYRQKHIAGAIYAHLDRDLSGPVEPGRTGRHPLPTVEQAAKTFGSWGIGPDTQVVVYDDMGGSMAARLWWMLRWLGHEAVAVIDGGWQRWVAAELPTRGGVETRPPAAFVARPRPELVVDAAAVAERAHDAAYRILDARSGERFRGEHEPIDPVAGHIPGAVSAPLSDNLDASGTFRSAEELRSRYANLLGDVPPEHTIVYCGSGVSAAHNLLALAHAGLGDARLYAGSWSEWITDPDRPIERG